MGALDPNFSVAPIIELKTDKEVVAMWRDLLFGIWLTPGTAADIRLGVEALRRCLARRPGPIAMLNLVHPQAVGPVDAEGRAAIAEQSHLVDPRSKASALVILSGGFSGAMIRGIATGLNLVSRVKHPTKTFDAVAPACAWLAPYVDRLDGRAATGEDLLALFEQLPVPPKDLPKR